MNAQNKTHFKAFEAIGVELEYMIVDSENLAVKPIADQLFAEATQQNPPPGDIETGWIDWSNELANHVVELKNAVPDRDLEQLKAGFFEQVGAINRILKEKFESQLLPTAMHPFMQPETESQLWPHGDQKIYAAYDRIFNCKGHGWTNLQSVHINLPFSSEEEFVALHEAIRFILPLIPGLTASSPFIEAKKSAWMDARIQFYMLNQAKIPSITGEIIPESIASYADYHLLLKKLYKDIGPFDTDHLLAYEWLNSRGAIARFDRNAIEIRLMDIQESPRADLALVCLIVRAVEHIYQRLIKTKMPVAFHERRLKEMLLNGAKGGSHSSITDVDYLRFMLDDHKLNHPMSLKELWVKLFDHLVFLPNERVLAQDASILIERGSLSEVITIHCQDSKTSIIEFYKKLAMHLEQNTLCEG